MRRGPYGSALATGRLQPLAAELDRATRLKRPKHCSTSPERPLQQAHWPFVGFGQPRFCDGEHLVSAAWELLLSDTGKSLRLCIHNVRLRSSFRRVQKERRPRVDAAEIEALHGMHVYQWPPAVPRRCVTFGRASGQLGEAEARRSSRRSHGDAHGRSLRPGRRAR